MAEDEFDLKALIATPHETREHTYRRGYRTGYLAAVQDMRSLYAKRYRKDEALELCLEHGESALSDWMQAADNPGRVASLPRLRVAD